MSKNNVEDKSLQAVPFFARFLEGQNCEDLSEQESETISGGNAKKTKKPILYDPKINPITVISSPSLGITNKYPSDGDDYIRPDDPNFQHPPKSF